LLLANPDIKNFHFDFSEPHKIDLKDFMMSNYKFNVRIEHYAKLTGRCLAGLKRDFQKTFGVPPRLWLQNKRLIKAHYQLEKIIKGRH
jgi:AraC-like DNA-binding protein